MSQENVELVRRLFDYGANNQESLRETGVSADHAFLSMWHPDCVLEELEEMPDAAAYHGRAGVARYFEQIPDLWDELTYTPAEILDGPDGVLAPKRLVDGGDQVVATVEFRAIGKPSGVSIAETVAHVWTLKSGRIIAWHVYLEPAKALEAVGLRE